MYIASALSNFQYLLKKFCITEVNTGTLETLPLSLFHFFICRPQELWFIRMPPEGHRSWPYADPCWSCQLTSTLSKFRGKTFRKTNLPNTLYKRYLPDRVPYEYFNECRAYLNRTCVSFLLLIGIAKYFLWWAKPSKYLN